MRWIHDVAWSNKVYYLGYTGNGVTEPLIYREIPVVFIQGTNAAWKIISTCVSFLISFMSMIFLWLSYVRWLQLVYNRFLKVYMSHLYGGIMACNRLPYYRSFCERNQSVTSRFSSQRAHNDFFDVGLPRLLNKQRSYHWLHDAGM